MFLLSLLVACGSDPTPSMVPAAETVASAPAKVDPLVERAKSLVGRLPSEVSSEVNPVTSEKITLGRMLFYDTRLSLANDVSCNSCHLLDHYGVDGLATSTGHKGQKGGRNAPTVYNAAGHLAQFWDGRSPTVEDQAKGPPLNPIEMAMPNPEAVAKAITAVSGYAPLFEKAFPGEKAPITFDNMAMAIGAFERRLITSSPFDQFASGNLSALTDEQKAGFSVFLDVGCVSCHTGPYLGGSMYMKLGQVRPYEDADVGRFAVTQSESDRQVFKVPSLRNVEKTAPYFHTGQVKTLKEAITLMGAHQLGKDLSSKQVDQIALFLTSLTGALPTEYIKRPELP